MLTAPELFALSQGSRCEGPEACHWCGAPCKSLWLHDDPPPLPFVKNANGAKKPNNRFICIGCWLFRRERTTVRFLSGTFKDRQAATNHSWWITATEALAVPFDKHTLYKVLDNPPKKFCAALVTSGVINRLHLAAANDLPGIDSSTQLIVNINNVPFSFTTYDLQHALSERDFSGREPGTRELISFIGWPKEPPKPLQKSVVGRYGHEQPRKATKKVIAASGS